MLITESTPRVTHNLYAPIQKASPTNTQAPPQNIFTIEFLNNGIEPESKQ